MEAPTQWPSSSTPFLKGNPMTENDIQLLKKYVEAVDVSAAADKEAERCRTVCEEILEAIEIDGTREIAFRMGKPDRLAFALGVLEGLKVVMHEPMAYIVMNSMPVKSSDISEIVGGCKTLEEVKRMQTEYTAAPLYPPYTIHAVGPAIEVRND